jgi:hypothetical protein
MVVEVSSLKKDNLVTLRYVLMDLKVDREAGCVSAGITRQ